MRRKELIELLKMLNVTESQEELLQHIIDSQEKDRVEDTFLAVLLVGFLLGCLFVAVLKY